ncbi:hypothetical protein SUDANB25_02492 [Streptomyces sp. SudanB25_2051]
MTVRPTGGPAQAARPTRGPAVTAHAIQEVPL